MKFKILLSKIFNFIILKISSLQGKGWSINIKKEVDLTLSLLSVLNKSVELCIDVGGNKGFYTEEIIKKKPNCSVIIFEPSNSNAKHLKEKFINNNKVKIEQFGLSNINSKTHLFTDFDGSAMASLTKRRLDHLGIDFSLTENIETIRFEDYWKDKLGRKNIDLFKLDIEGHEMDALKGMGEAINYTKIVQFEFGGCNIDTRTYFRDFWFFFKEKNFDLFRQSPLGLIKVINYQESEEFFSYTNYIAKKN
jgi:FkbM family methyltransferase